VLTFHPVAALVSTFAKVIARSCVVLLLRFVYATARFVVMWSAAVVASWPTQVELCASEKSRVNFAVDVHVALLNDLARIPSRSGSIAVSTMERASATSSVCFGNGTRRRIVALVGDIDLLGDSLLGDIIIAPAPPFISSHDGMAVFVLCCVVSLAVGGFWCLTVFGWSPRLKVSARGAERFGRPKLVSCCTEEERPKHADVPVVRLARYTAPYLVFVVVWYGTTTSFSTASRNQPDPYVRTSVK